MKNIEKSSVKYKVAFVGMVKNQLPEMTKLNKILQEKHPQYAGIWIYEKDRDCILEMLKQITNSQYKIDENAFYDEIETEMKKNVEKDILERLQSEFNVDAKVEIDLTIDENHNIKGVNVIRIHTWKNPDGMIERLKEVYGCDKIEIRLE